MSFARRWAGSLIGLWWRLIRFGFRLLYNELAFTYDTVSKIVSLGAWRCWQRAAIKHLGVKPGELVLELAHGTGDLQLDLKAAGYLTVGCDLSPYMGRIARAKLLRNGLTAPLVRGRAQRLPFASERFPVVVATFPTSFILEAGTLQEINRVLFPGGRLVVVPNGRFIGGGIVRRFLEWLYRITGQRKGPVEGGLHAELHTRFAEYGFELRFTEEPCPRSVAQVVIAIKHEEVLTTL
jgi:ubiquinone/menaquinone biosynthesis C-methylase UbiE